MKHEGGVTVSEGVDEGTVCEEEVVDEDEGTAGEEDEETVYEEEEAIALLVGVTQAHYFGYGLY